MTKKEQDEADRVSPLDKICPFRSGSILVKCLGEACGLWSDVTTRYDFRRKHIVGCAPVVRNKLWKIEV